MKEKKMEQDTRRKIEASVLGNAREIVFFQNGHCVKNEKHSNEVFFTIEKKNEYGGYETTMHGYIAVTQQMKTIFDMLIRDRSHNQHIAIIEWGDSYNVVFEDGVYISQIMCRLEKDEFEKWESGIIPVN